MQINKNGKVTLIIIATFLAISLIVLFTATSLATKKYNKVKELVYSFDDDLSYCIVL